MTSKVLPVAMPVRSRDKWLLFILVFLIEIAIGLYLELGLNYIQNDAMSRTANAFYVLFIKPPRLASVGFVWNPLPSILQIPILFIAGSWRLIASKGISGTIVSALSAAFSSLILMETFQKYGISRITAILLTLCYALNPFMLLYGANGMSEATFYALLLLIITSLLLWQSRNESYYLVRSAFGMAALFFVRYESVVFAIDISLCIICYLIFEANEKKYWEDGGKKEHFYYIEGSIYVFLIPFGYSVLLWMALNWIIQDDPLYFMTSVYSNASQSQVLDSYTLGGAIQYALPRLIPFISLFLAILLIRIWRRKFFHYETLELTILVISMIAFHMVMMMKGNSFGWLRFFSYSLPVCMGWLPFEIWKSSADHKGNSARIISAAALIISGFLCFQAFQNPDVSKEERNLIIPQDTDSIANFINDNLNGNKILMDSFLTNSIVLEINDLDNVVTTCSPDFQKYVQDPVKMGIQFILIPEPVGTGKLDVINERYPKLYKSGMEWAVEYARFDGYRIFKLIE